MRRTEPLRTGRLSAVRAPFPGDSPRNGERDLAPREALFAIADPALDGLGAKDLVPELLERLEAFLDPDEIGYSAITDDLGEPTLEPRAYRGKATGAPSPVPLRGSLLARVIERREALIIEEIAATLETPTREASPACLSTIGAPVATPARTLGVLWAGSASRARFAPGDLMLLEIAAGRIASQLERERLEAELSRVNREAELTSRRTALLAQAAGLLGAAPDYETTIASVARLAVPVLADWCFVDLFDDAGEWRRLAAARGPTEPVEIGERLSHERAVGLGAARGPGRVVRTGEPELWPEVSDEMLAASAKDQAGFEVLRRLGLRSLLCVPLFARGRLLGTLTLATATSGRRYGKSDLALAEDLASHIALAIDNAHLRSKALEASERSEESRALLDMLAEAAPVGLAVLDHQLRYVRVNGALASMRGRSREEQMGRTIAEAWPDVGPRLEPMLRRALASGGAAASVEVSGESPAHGGEVRHWLVSHGPIRAASGAVLGLGQVVTDLTDRRRAEEERIRLLARERAAHDEAEEQRARLYALLMQLPAPIAIHRGPEHVFEIANPMYRSGIGDRELIGRPVRGALPELVDSGYVRILDRVYRTGEPFIDPELPITLAWSGDGAPTTRHFNVVVQPLRDAGGNVEGIIACGLDVSEEVESKRRVHALVRELEADELELQRALVLRDQFVSLASHELKTPITALQLQVQSLIRAGSRAAPDALVPKLRVIERQALRLGELVEALLDLSRIRDGRLTVSLEEVDLGDVLSGTLTRLADDLARAQCELRLDACGPVSGVWDPTRIDQIVGQLLSNAMKYGAGRPIDVVLRADELCASIEVCDRGIGIAPEHLERIFQPFERASSARHYGGFGVGLWISQRIAEALGGTIRVKSRADEGACFTVELPRAPAPKPPSL